MQLYIENWEFKYTNFNHRTGESAGKIIGIGECWRVWQIKLVYSTNEHGVTTFRYCQDRIYG